MDNIIEPNELFDFSNISLAHPIGLQGGSYFTKIEYNKKPLYIQTSKSLTRQGFVKTGKKYYCDLMFDATAEDLINWCEHLEQRCHKLIYEKKNTWFENNLEENDIQSAFNTLIRVYKSGKFYLLRANVKNTKEDEPIIKIYDENEQLLSIDDIKPDTSVISILEIQGIKFTSRNFQIDINIKQLMVVNTEQVFEQCLIKTSKSKSNPLTSTPNPIPIPINTTTTTTINTDTDTDTDTNTNANTDTDTDANIDLEDMDETTIQNTLQNATTTTTTPTPIATTTTDNNDTPEEINIDIEFEDLLPATDELKEVDDIDNEFNIDVNDSSSQSITLKKPNQVYYELYKEARTKAKNAKKNAIIAYLEAKNIKNTYMVETIDDSDSDIDAEIDEVSESELDGL